MCKKLKNILNENIYNYTNIQDDHTVFIVPEQFLQ